MLKHLRTSDNRVKTAPASIVYGTLKNGDRSLSRVDFREHFNVFPPVLIGDGLEIGCRNIFQPHRLYVDLDVPVDVRRCKAHMEDDVPGCRECAVNMMTIADTSRAIIESILHGKSVSMRILIVVLVINVAVFDVISFVLDSVFMLVICFWL
jgi:hypothetical protein